MNPLRLVALVLLAAGILALVYGGFTYTKKTHKASFGPIELAVQEKETVDVPVWAGVAGIVAGGGLLVLSGRKR